MEKITFNAKKIISLILLFVIILNCFEGTIINFVNAQENNGEIKITTDNLIETENGETFFKLDVTKIYTGNKTYGGATPNDNTDDFESIQSIINLARIINKRKNLNPNNYKTKVFFPKGIYIISETVFVKAGNIEIYGEGDRESIIKFKDNVGEHLSNGNSKTMIKVQQDEGEIYRRDVKDVTIRNLTIDGNKENRIINKIDLETAGTYDVKIEQDEVEKIYKVEITNEKKIILHNFPVEQGNLSKEEYKKITDTKTIVLKSIILNTKYDDWGKGCVAKKTLKYYLKDDEQNLISKINSEVVQVSDGNGIAVYRKFDDKTLEDVKIEDCTIKNMPGPAVRIIGNRQIVKNEETKTDKKDQDGNFIYEEPEVKQLNEKYDNGNEKYEDRDLRKYTTRICPERTKVINCDLEYSLIGISQNTADATEIIGNNIYQSIHENLTIDMSDNCKCINNKLGKNYQGCGNIGTDESKGSIIQGNIIDNTENKAAELWNAGICINSEAGISEDYLIADNEIIGANYGIFLKDSRKNQIENYKLYKTHNSNYSFIKGSRPGKDIYLINNKITEYKIYGIRIDEMIGHAYVCNNDIQKTEKEVIFKKDENGQDLFEQLDIFDNPNNKEENGNETIFDSNFKLTSIKVSKNPEKMVYEQGEDFDKTGMVIKAVYTKPNGETYEREIYEKENDYEGFGYIIAGGTNLSLNNNEINIYYYENNEKYKTTLNGITVKISLQDISLDVQNKEIYKNDTFDLKVSYNPLNTTDDKNITWTSSDETVATVDKDGMVTGVGKGTATITATSSNGKIAECKVIVKQHIESISLSNKTIIKGKTKSSITKTITPASYDDTITWSSSNTNIVTVDKYGKVYGIAVGTAIITAKSSNGIEASCTVTVTNNVTKIEIISPEKTVYEYGESLELDNIRFVATYQAGETKEIFLNEEGVTVSGYNKNLVGNQTVKVKYQGKEAEFTVSVKKSLQSISFNVQEQDMYVGESAEFTISYNPVDVTDIEEITYSLDSDSNAELIKIDNNKVKVNAINRGNAIIIAQSSSGKRASCNINIKQHIENISLNKVNETVTKGSKLQIEATLIPTEHDDDRKITWTSSNTNVATVDKNGMVFAKNIGEAVITATTSNGKQATCSITVTDSVRDIELIAPTKTKYEVGESLNLDGGKLKILYDSNVISNTQATVVELANNSNIEIAGYNSEVLGNQQITVTYNDPVTNGKFNKTFNVTVINSIESISIAENLKEMDIGDQKYKLTVQYTGKNEDKEVTEDTRIIWKSLNSSVATVDIDGNVRAISYGTAKIKAILASSQNTENEIFAECTIKVKKHIESISLEDAEIIAGNTLLLEREINPADNDDTIEWQSSDTSIATVDQTGKVTAIKAGSVTITAIASNGVQATCNVTVLSKIRITEIRLLSMPTKTKYEVGESLKLTGGTIEVLYLDGMTEKTATRKMTNGLVKVTGFDSTDVGEKTLTATYKGFSTNFNVQVVNSIESIVISPSSKDINIGEQNVKLNVEYIGKNTEKEVVDDKELVWESSNEDIALVDDEGNVTPVSRGSVTIKATLKRTKNTSNEIYSECSVNVKNQIESITLNDVSMVKRDTILLDREIVPSVNDNTITWTSSKETVATVDNDGNVTAVAVGSATITATASNGVTASCIVTVHNNITQINISTMPTKTVYEVGETLDLSGGKLKATYESGTSYLALTKSSINVTGFNNLSTGIQTLTVEYKGHTTELNVEVKNSIKNIELSNESLEIMKGNSATLNASCNLTNNEIASTENTTISWNCSDESVVSMVVGSNNDVTLNALKTGEVQITASCLNGMSATCNVVVYSNIVKIEVSSKPNKTVYEVGESLDLKGGKIKVTYLDGEETKTVIKSMTNSNVKVSGFNSESTGTKTLTVTYKNDFSTEFNVEVKNSITGIELNKTLLNMETGNSTSLSAVCSLTNNEIPSTDSSQITWTSLDENVATIVKNADETVTVTAVGRGSTEITAVTSNGKTATCKVEVKQHIQNIELNDKEMLIDETTSVVSKINPSEYDDTLTWLSSNDNVATVDAFGNVTAVSRGTVTISVESSNGKSASCTVSVKQYIDSLELEDVQMVKGTTKNLIDNSILENDDTITWSSSKETVATVDQTGKVSAIAVGTAIITATTSKGITETCTVTVHNNPTKIEISKLPTKTKYEISEPLDLEGGTIKVTYENDNNSSKDMTNNYVHVTGFDSLALGTKTLTVEYSGFTDTFDVEVVNSINKISLNKKSYNLYIGDPSYKLNVNYTGNDANSEITDDKSILWTSNNEDVAVVDNEGNVTAIARGNATIKALLSRTAGTEDEIYAECKITVKQNITSINLEDMQIINGKTASINKTITPEINDDKITWSSSNEDVAKVDNDGNVTTVSNGTAIITASSTKGITATCTVTVHNDIAKIEIAELPTKTVYEVLEDLDLTGGTINIVFEDESNIECNLDDENIAVSGFESSETGTKHLQIEYTEPTSLRKYYANFDVRVINSIKRILLSEISKEMELEDETFKLNVSYLGKNEDVEITESKEILWESSNENVAIVDQQGNVTLRSGGNAVIKATLASSKNTENEISAKCQVKVKKHIESIVLNKTELAIINGKTAQITAIVSPDEYDDILEWTSSNEEVVTVNQKGVIKAIKNGTAEVMLSSSNGKSAICNITVHNNVEKIELTDLPEKTEYNKGEELDLTGGIILVTFEDSSEIGIDLNDENIQITGYDKNVLGNQQIKVSYEGKEAFFDINVDNKLINIYLNKNEILLNKDEEFNLIVAYNPEDTLDDKKIIWTSSDENVATVDENGKVVAVGPGNANITAEAINGKFATCAIIVPDDFDEEDDNPTKPQDEDYVDDFDDDLEDIEKLQIKFRNTLNINNSYIENIKSNTKISDFLKDMKTNGEIKIYKDEAEIMNNDEIITTGMKLSISLNDEVENFVFVVKGDVDGNGIVDINDIMQINKHRLNKIILKDEYYLAANVIKDNTLDLKDILQINKFRLGKINNL